jgi:predicted RNA-binding Zn ribbon-like protein
LEVILETNGKTFYFIGNALWLDFVNTEIIQDGVRVDLLESVEDLLSWAISAEVLTRADADGLANRWAQPSRARQALAQAKEFRAALRNMAERLNENRNPPSAIIDTLNDVLRHWTGFPELVRVKGRIEERVVRQFTDSIHLMVPIAETAADLLTSGDLNLVRKCENPACILFFYDTTKNHARRWCSMGACGNREKVATYYRRTRQTAM